VQATGPVRRSACFILLLLLASACSRGPGDADLVRALDLLDEIRALNLREPPVRELTWRPLQQGRILEGRELLLTAPASRLTLRIPGQPTVQDVQGYFPLGSLGRSANRPVRVERVEGRAWWCRPPTVAPWLAREVPLPVQRSAPPGQWGFTGRPVQPGNALYPGLGSAGVAVALVGVETSAQRLGLRPGDVVLAVDGQKTSTPEQLAGRLRGRSQAVLHVFRWPVIWRGTLLAARPGPDGFASPSDR